MFGLALFVIFFVITTPVHSLPRLRNVSCSPNDVYLGRTVNITWDLDEDPRKPSRGVFSWQVYARNALIDVEGQQTPITGPAGTNLLSESNIEAPFDWYRYGPYGLVNYTNQPLCTSMPYGNDTDGLGNPEGYSEQTFCPLDCKVRASVVKYTYFESLDFKPKRVRVGDNLNITWTYQKGANFPRYVLLSIFFASNYFEEYPQFVINNVNASTGQYTLRVGEALRSFVTTNERKIEGRFPYRLYMQLTFAPQTNALGGVIAPGNLTVLPALQNGGRKRSKPSANSEIWRRMKKGVPAVAPISVSHEA
ncbi:hypothetical protein SpCBS45565_g06191 [Spizellomyces sp. 'palustris']|nr:hypothetical protein SpCBS45565_g06191 [Spizellomyces sp. 'palustris']